MASLVAVLSIGDGMEAFVRGEIERTTARFSLADADLSLPSWPVAPEWRSV